MTSMALQLFMSLGWLQTCALDAVARGATLHSYLAIFVVRCRYSPVAVYSLPWTADPNVVRGSRNVARAAQPATGPGQRARTAIPQGPGFGLRRTQGGDAV